MSAKHTTNAAVRVAVNAERPSAMVQPVAWRTMKLRDLLQEVTAGVGERWADFPLIGATRAGIAPAKEAIGKKPERYKLVVPGTIFYNPMRILLGSIAMVDEGEPPGITSPDYVVVTCIEGELHPLWFYHWFRSQNGVEFIKSLTRGAVRERLLFNRLAKGEMILPDWEAQLVLRRSAVPSNRRARHSRRSFHL